jgi:glycosyltransferase involved in cell wall biosynthesis
MRRLVRRLKPDVLHFVDPVGWANMALLGCRVPRILHVHGPVVKHVTLWARLASFLFKATADHFVCVSRETSQKAFAAGIARREAHTVIYNAVECARFGRNVSVADARRHCGLPRDAKLLGMVCRLAPEKGCLDAVRLLACLPPQYHLVICGDGPLREQITGAATALGVKERIHLLGFLDHVEQVYAAMGFFLTMSRAEPFGLAIAEAMAAERPVVGVLGEAGCLDPEFPLVTEKNSMVARVPAGLPFDRELPEDCLRMIAARIVELDGNHAELRRMTMAARIWVEERFSASRQIRDVTSLYRRLALDGQPSPGYRMRTRVPHTIHAGASARTADLRNQRDDETSAL